MPFMNIFSMISNTLTIGLNNHKQNNHMIKLYFSSETKKTLRLTEELNAEKLKKGSIITREPFFMLNLLSI